MDVPVSVGGRGGVTRRAARRRQSAGVCSGERADRAASGEGWIDRRCPIGCDIHCYIEYQTPGGAEAGQWSNFGGRINPGRDYEVFGRLAGARGGSALVAPRGFPDDAAFEAMNDFWLFIDYSGDGNGEGHTTPERAQKYVKEYRQRYRGGSHDKPTCVSDPDWHSHSWLTTAEWADAIGSTAGVEYIGILGAMRAMESDGAKCRVVFWFDN